MGFANDFKMTASDLQRGQKGTIRNLVGENAICQRLSALGFLPGVEVELVCVAPLGDPITLEAMGQRLSMRRSEATIIELHDED